MVETYEVGYVLKDRSPENLASLIEDIRHNTENQEHFNQKLELAARDLCWQREEEKLIKLYRQAYELVNEHNA